MFWGFFTLFLIFCVVLTLCISSVVCKILYYNGAKYLKLHGMSVTTGTISNCDVCAKKLSLWCNCSNNGLELDCSIAYSCRLSFAAVSDGSHMTVTIENLRISQAMYSRFNRIGAVRNEIAVTHAIGNPRMFVLTEVADDCANAHCFGYVVSNSKVPLCLILICSLVSVLLSAYGPWVARYLFPFLLVGAVIQFFSMWFRLGATYVNGQVHFHNDAILNYDSAVPLTSDVPLISDVPQRVDVEMQPPPYGTVAPSARVPTDTIFWSLSSSPPISHTPMPNTARLPLFLFLVENSCFESRIVSSQTR